jgi:signal transduction histidine kinase
MLKFSRSLRDSPHHVRLIIWFMAVSFAVIALIGILIGTLMSRFITHEMLERDLVVSTEFLNSLVRVEQVTSYFYGDTQNPSAPGMVEFFSHVASLPAVLGANIYGADGTILWSSDPTRIGRRFRNNDDLDAAMRGELHSELGYVESRDKAEYVNFPEGLETFIEGYLPIWSEDDQYVVGAVEVYKSPERLIAAIHKGTMLVWTGAALGGLFLYGGLLVVVIYAARILRRQEARLVETERLAVVGEMASAVAHGLRNPLAAIRSSAELLLEDDLSEDVREPISDIINQSDRLESWIRAFLIRAREQPDTAARLTPLDPIIRSCLSNFSSQMMARNIICSFREDADGPLIGMPAPELEQVLNSTLSNCIEAMRGGGRIRIRRVMQIDGRVHITITDTGPGIPDELKPGLFTPFQTGKSSGIGVGLALARRIMERFGGSLNLENAPPYGVEVTLTVPAQGNLS